MIEEFAGLEAQANFEQWAREHRDGFFINKKRSPPTLCLHGTSCKHVFRPDGTLWPRSTVNAKLCSLDRHELERWARDRGMALPECKDCFPPKY